MAMNKKHTEAPVPYYPEYDQLYGPYIRKDGRKIVIVRNSTSYKQQTISYPKYLIEVESGQRLSGEITVDHIDRDFTNDSFDNLQPLDRANHTRKDAYKLVPVTIICNICGTTFILDGKKLSSHFRNKRIGKPSKSGPYCSKRCAGIASTTPSLRYTHNIEREYYR